MSKSDYEFMAEFRNTLREFLHFSEGAALAFGVQPQQHQAMLVIRGDPERDFITVSKLAARLQIRHHSAVGLVNRMKIGGLVVKKRDSTDKRKILVRLTPRGKRVLKSLSAIHKTELARIGPVLREVLRNLKAAS